VNDERELAELVREALYDRDEDREVDIAWMRDATEAGLLTGDEVLVIKFGNGKVFQLKIQERPNG
jgi:hypothetical protein